MGLRSDLEDILALQELTGGFATSAQQLRQQAANQQLAQELPGLLAQNDYGQIAALAGQTNDPSLRRSIVEKQMAAQLKPAGVGGKIPLTREQVRIKLIGTPQEGNDEVIDSIAGINNLPTQEKFILDYSVGGRQETRRKQQAGQFGATFGEKLTKAKDDQRKAFISGIEEVEKPYKEFEEGYKNVQGALSTRSKTGDAIVFNFVARSIGNEKGPLARDDIQRLIQETFGMKAAELQNYLQGKDVSVLSPAQRETLYKIVEIAFNNKAETLQQNLSERFSNAPADYPRLFEGGSPDASVRNRLSKFGATDISVRDGKLSFRAGKKKSEAIKQFGQETDGATKGPDTVSLLNQANALPASPANDKFKQDTVAIIKAWDAKGGIPQDKYDELMNRIKRRAAGGK